MDSKEMNEDEDNIVFLCPRKAAKRIKELEERIAALETANWLKSLTPLPPVIPNYPAYPNYRGHDVIYTTTTNSY